MENKIEPTNEKIAVEGQRESGTDALEVGYGEYLALGGILKKDDYVRVLEEAKDTREIEMTAQAEVMAGAAGFEINDFDKEAVLYGVLRRDTTHDYSHMSNQALFAEALKMSGNKNVDKFIEANPYNFRSK
jgi:hypothetical protein